MSKAKKPDRPQPPSPFADGLFPGSILWFRQTSPASYFRGPYSNAQDLIEAIHSYLRHRGGAVCLGADDLARRQLNDALLDFYQSHPGIETPPLLDGSDIILGMQKVIAYLIALATQKQAPAGPPEGYLAAHADSYTSGLSDLDIEILAQLQDFNAPTTPKDLCSVFKTAPLRTLRWRYRVLAKEGYIWHPTQAGKPGGRRGAILTDKGREALADHEAQET